MSRPASVEAIEQLVTGDGRQLLDLLAELPDDETRSFRLGSQLRERFPSQLVAAALAQHQLRLAGASKFVRAAEMYFTRDGLEQASSEMIARHRAARYPPAASVADLCCGIGGDSVALAAAHEVLCVDLDPVHLRLAELNAMAYEVESAVRTVPADVREIDLVGSNAVFVDPARRKQGRRLDAGLSDPPLEWCLSLTSRVTSVGVKAAPGISHDDIPPGWEAEFIAIGRELKEAALWSPAMAGPLRRATILPEGHTLTAAANAPDGAVPVRSPGRYLLDPNPAVTRAGVVEELARSLDAWKVDDQIAFLSADHPLSTPFGRGLSVLESLPWSEKDVRAALRRLGAGPIDIRRRGLAGDVDRIRARLKAKGDRPVVVMMTRVSGRPWGLICEAVS